MTDGSSNIARSLSYIDERGETQVIDQDEILWLPGPIVVLGEPGQGKSVLLGEIATRARLPFITAKQLLRRSAIAMDGRALVIDALDEVVTAREADAVQRVLEKLDAMGGPDFILSCRAADWQGAIAAQDIEADYGRAPIVLTLLPLSRDDALHYLATHVQTGDPETLVTHLEDRDLDSLYGNPLTLRLFAEVAGATALPDSRGALFHAACNILWREEAIQHEVSPLSNLSEAEALDAAGAASALQILTGADAISTRAVARVDANDRALRDVEQLPMGAVARAVLASRLFAQVGEQRFAPLHRVIGEYLGARWLAGLLAANVSPRRLFSLLTLADTVPASLRGLHAWIAYYSDAAAARVIATDPFGVVRYGDAGALSTPKARLLLETLEVLAAEDPYFRAQDWGQLSVHGLARSDLQAEFERILDQSSNFHLRKLLLEAINGSPLATAMEARLRALALNVEATFSERAEAAEALVSVVARDAWPAIIDTLRGFADGDSTRLAIEMLTDLDLGAFTDQQLVETIAAFLGYSVSPIDREGQWTRQVVGAMPLFARKIPNARAAGLLDLLTDYIPIPASKDNWERRWELANLASTLILQALPDDQVAPARIWRWLKLLDPFHGRNRDDHLKLEEFFGTDLALRRAVQRHVLFELSGKTLWERGWRLRETLGTLGMTPQDALGFLEELADQEARDPLHDQQWKDLVQLARTHEGLTAEARAIARRYARGNSELLAFLRKVARPVTNRWEKQHERRRLKEEQERQATHAQHRADFLAHDAALRAGELQWVVPAARAYLGLFRDTDREQAPLDRVQTWLGDAITESAAQGFEASLFRPDLPTPAQVVEGFSERRIWNMVYPIVAGLAERIRDGRGLDDVPRDTLRVGWLSLQHESYLDDLAKIDDFAERLERRLALEPIAFAEDFRLLIEPQLQTGHEHVSGLYRLMRAPALRGLGARLAAEWIERYPALPLTIELELIDGILSARELALLAGLWQQHCPDVTADRERALAWLAVAFVADFERARPDLDRAVAELPTLIWPIRSRLRRDEQGSRIPVTPAQLAWIVSTFRGLWPNVGHPNGVSSGDMNPWDAAELVRWAISALAGDTSEEAMDCLAALRAAPQDSYSDLIRHSAAQQRRARNEANFAPVTPARITAVACNKPPASIDDLHAALLDSLATVQSKLQGSETNPLAAFYASDGTPHGENYCRDRLVEWLQRELPPGVSQATETRMPSDKRSDIAFVSGDALVPVEIKAQWHPRVWDAAIDQLDCFYTKEWRAAGRGIYVVLWFGDVAAQTKQLTRPPQGAPPVHSAADLRQTLQHRIPEARRGQLAVVVIDLVR